MNYPEWRTNEVERLYQECLNLLPQYNDLEWLRQDIILSYNENLFPSIEIFIEAQREVLNRNIWYHRNIDICNLNEVTAEFQRIIADEIMQRLQ